MTIGVTDRGSVVQRVGNTTIDESGNVIDDSTIIILHTYLYDAFGNELFSNTNSDGDISNTSNNTNPWRFNGEYLDTETGTYYLRARHFNPRTGRFTQPDPHWGIHNMMSDAASIIQSGNLYVFTMHNPIRWIDPSGLVGVLLQNVMDRFNEVFGGGFSFSIVDNDRVGRSDGGRSVSITIGDITQTYRLGSRDAYFISDILIFESDRLVADFGLSRWMAEHQAYVSRFDSADHAALAWSLKYWGLSNAEYAEFTSNIYRTSQGRYFFSEATFHGADVSNRQRRANAQSPLPGFELSAIIHTHIQLRPLPIAYGYLIPGETSWFSDSDRNVSTLNRVPLYMAAPNNNLRVIDPGERFGSTVFRNLRY